MTQQSDLIHSDIDAYLAQHEHKELLKMLTCGSVDDGKSTLIGRLLHDSHVLYEDQLAEIQQDSTNKGSQSIDLALLVDGLQAEREQGITIDVAYRFFSTTKRKFIIADTPGHEQYTRNMVTAASTCDLAIILIDACHGVQTQTKRHSFICSLLGIKNIIVVVNKMDLVDFNEQVFEDIRQDYLAFATDLEYKNVQLIPIVALHGDNVVNASERMQWYKGSTLITLLENSSVTTIYNYDVLRFPVQYVNRPNPDFRGFCGTLASGVVSTGDLLTVLPSGLQSRVKSIVTHAGELQQAFTPMSVTLKLEDEIDISRGDLLVDSNQIPLVQVGKKFMAILVWLTKQRMLPGTDYDIKHAGQYVRGQVSTLQYKFDINNLQEILTPALEMNEIGMCELNLTQAICVDDYKFNQSTGSFIMIDRLTNETVGAGMIVDASVKKTMVTKTHVTPQERIARYGQRPATVLFTGLSGSGKSTLAYALERRLFNMGRSCTVLDSQSIDLGVNEQSGHDQLGGVDSLRSGAHIARHMNDSGLICCAAFAAPEQVTRTYAQGIIGKKRFLIVYLDTPIAVCQKRDPNGLYSASVAGAGEVATYESVEETDLILQTEQLTVADCIEQVLDMLCAKGILSTTGMD